MSDFTREQSIGPLGDVHHFAMTQQDGVRTYYLDGERVESDHPWFVWLRTAAPLNAIDGDEP